jgi:hypothetical protein
MATVRKVITDQYVDILAPVYNSVYIQNRGSYTIEIYLSSTPPTASTEGLTVLPGQLGLNFTLDADESCYIKTESIGDKSQIVVVY